MLTWELWLAIAAVAGALVLARFWRSAESRADDLQADVESLRARAEKLETKLSRESSTRQRQAEELAGLRKKSDKAKRRQSKTPEQPLGTLARIRDHEAEVERLERERTRVAGERDELEKEVSRLQTRLAASAQELADATAEPEPTPEPAPDAAAREVSALRGDLAEARERTSKLDEELGARRVTEARLRKRMENQEQLYASMRAELDVKKDRLRTQEEQLQRLQALKVAVVD